MAAGRNWAFLDMFSKYKVGLPFPFSVWWLGYAAYTYLMKLSIFILNKYIRFFSWLELCSRTDGSIFCSYFFLMAKCQTKKLDQCR